MQEGLFQFAGVRLRDATNIALTNASTSLSISGSYHTITVTGGACCVNTIAGTFSQ